MHINNHASLTLALNQRDLRDSEIKKLWNLLNDTHDNDDNKARLSLDGFAAFMQIGGFTQESKGLLGYRQSKYDFDTKRWDSFASQFQIPYSFFDINSDGDKNIRINDFADFFDVEFSPELQDFVDEGEKGLSFQNFSTLFKSPDEEIMA